MEARLQVCWVCCAAGADSATRQPRRCVTGDVCNEASTHQTPVSGVLFWSANCFVFDHTTNPAKNSSHFVGHDLKIGHITYPIIKPSDRLRTHRNKIVLLLALESTAFFPCNGILRHSASLAFFFHCILRPFAGTVAILGCGLSLLGEEMCEGALF